MLASVGATVLGFGLTPWMAALGSVALAVTLFALAAALFAFGWWLPVAVPAAAVITSMMLAYLVRFPVVERSLDAGGLSGLAKAFFYAGARSLLVSHWPVWSKATLALTTGPLRNWRTTQRSAVPRRCAARLCRAQQP
jgi:hypothetical protein